MAILAEMLASIIGLVVTCAIVLLTILAFRNPHRPDWLKGENTEMVATVGLLLISCLAIGAFIQSATDAGVDVVVTLVLVLVIPPALLIAIGWIIGYGGRLQKTDVGQSPFEVR